MQQLDKGWKVLKNKLHDLKLNENEAQETDEKLQNTTDKMVSSTFTSDGQTNSPRYKVYEMDFMRSRQNKFKQIWKQLVEA